MRKPQVEDELQALQSIFGTELNIVTCNGGSREEEEEPHVRLELSLHSSARLTLTLTSLYPEHAAPCVSLSNHASFAASISSIQQQCDELWRLHTPSVCCFEIIEHFRAACDAQEATAGTVNHAPDEVADSNCNASQQFISDHTCLDENAEEEEEEDQQAQQMRLSKRNKHLATIDVPSAATDAPSFVIAAPITEKKSVFIAYYCSASTFRDVQIATRTLHDDSKLSKATHIITAYRVAGSDGCDDDGETAAGSRMLHLLNILRLQDVFVAVVRWYGGVKLGAWRFKLINNATRQVLEKAGRLSKT